MRRCVILVTAAMMMNGVGTSADRPEGHSFATRSVVHAKHGMVAAAHPLAVEIGLAVLKDGGSAVDAAIAVNAALALDGAGLLRPRRRHLRHGLGSRDRDPARAQRLRARPRRR